MEEGQTTRAGGRPADGSEARTVIPGVAMNRNAIEHWRDGEKIGQFEVTQIAPGPDGSVRIVMPPGGIILASFDELHFNIDGLIEALISVRTT
jgi:hypothetical protein